MIYLVEFMNEQDAEKAVELLGGGHLSGMLHGKCVVFQTLQHAQWAKRQLEERGMGGITITEKEEGWR